MCTNTEADQFFISSNSTHFDSAFFLSSVYTVAADDRVWEKSCFFSMPTQIHLNVYQYCLSTLHDQKIKQFLLNEWMKEWKLLRSKLILNLFDSLSRNFFSYSWEMREWMNLCEMKVKRSMFLSERMKELWL